MRINLGCGDVHMDGFVNVDIRETEATDVVADASEYLKGLEADSVLQIEMHHVVEHLDKTAVPPLLAQAARVLKSGGFIAIECPNMGRMPAILTEGALRLIYGGQEHEHDYHKWGYTPQTLGKLVEGAGLRVSGNGDWSPGIRLVGVKP